jgi:hypothetical protein
VGDAFLCNAHQYPIRVRGGRRACRRREHRWLPSCCAPLQRERRCAVRKENAAAGGSFTATSEGGAWRAGGDICAINMAAAGMGAQCFASGGKWRGVDDC